MCALVTGVQTCALPIFVGGRQTATVPYAGWAFAVYLWHWPLLIFWMARTNNDTVGVGESAAILAVAAVAAFLTWRCVDPRRSEERRVGKEWVSPRRSRWSQYHHKKNNTDT